MDRKLIGRCEVVTFPELITDSLKSKVDTGAFGISLHVDKLELLDGELLFYIKGKEFRYKKYRTITVKNSFGKSQKRFSIFTKIKIGYTTYKFFVSLSNRNNMRYPVLIGRRFLYKFNYIVDVRKKNIYDTTKKM